MFNPSLLEWMAVVGGKTLDRGDSSADRVFEWHRTGTARRAIEQYGAGSARSNATAIFGTREIQDVAQYPQQRSAVGNVDVSVEAIHHKLGHT